MVCPSPGFYNNILTMAVIYVETPQYARYGHTKTIAKQVQLAGEPLLDSTLTHVTTWFALPLVLATALISNWIHLAHTSKRCWLACSSHTLEAFSRLGPATTRAGCWISDTTKRTQTRFISFADFLLKRFCLGLTLFISLARPCWKLGDPSFELPSYNCPPGDSHEYNGHDSQSRSGQWTNTGDSRHRTEAGVWSHGSFNTGDPFASLVLGEYQLEYLRWLESEARKLGCAVVPLPWLFPQTGGQPAYQFAMPPAPPVPIPSQPESFSFTIPGRDNDYNYTSTPSRLQTTNGRANSLLNSLQCGPYTPSLLYTYRLADCWYRHPGSG